MDDATFELLKRIDEGFEYGSGRYTEGERHRVAAIVAKGTKGADLRMDIMKAVEAEKAARKPTQTTVDEPPPRAEITDLMAALKASLAIGGGAK